MRVNIVFFLFTGEKEQDKQVENKRTSKGKWGFCFIFVQVKKKKGHRLYKQPLNKSAA